MTSPLSVPGATFSLCAASSVGTSSSAPRAALAPVAATVRAGRGDDPALAATAVAGGDVDELAEDAALDATYLAGAFAGRAALWLRARLRAQAAALRAQLRAVDDDGPLGAEGRFLEGQLDLHLAVGGARAGAQARSPHAA